MTCFEREVKGNSEMGYILYDNFVWHNIKCILFQKAFFPLKVLKSL